MNGLLTGLGFIVLEGALPLADVALALPRRAVRERVGPRRLALAETLHDSDGNEPNSAQFALFTHANKTLLAMPGYYPMTAQPDLERALSKRFGTAAKFSSHLGAQWVQRWRNGALDGEANGYALSPPEGLFGLTAPIPDDATEAVMRVTLAGYVGAPWAQIFPRQGAEAEFWRFVDPP